MSASPSAAQPVSILLVEDEEGMARLISFLLEREGYQVTHAADGLKGAEAIQKMAPPSLAILDMRVPYRNGLELLALIRSKPSWKGVPVVMLTSHTRERDVVRALEGGASDYIEKPFQPKEVVARLKRFLKPGKVPLGGPLAC